MKKPLLFYNERRGDTMETTFAIIILVAVMYFVIFIGAIIFIMKKRKSIFKQTIDPKPKNFIQTSKENKNQ